MNANAQVNCDGCGRGRGGGQRRTSEANERGARVYRGERPTNDDRDARQIYRFPRRTGEGRERRVTTRFVEERRDAFEVRAASGRSLAARVPPATRRWSHRREDAGEKPGASDRSGGRGVGGGGTHDEAREDQRGEVRDERPSRLGLVPPRVPRLLLRRARRRSEQPLRLRAARRDRRDGGHREPASRARGTLPRRAGGRGWCATTKPRATITPSGRRRRREDG